MIRKITADYIFPVSEPPVKEGVLVFDENGKILETGKREEFDPAEMETITLHSPIVRLETLLRWATLNGAKALGFDEELGSLDIGKTPGINLIRNINVHNRQLTSDSSVHRIA